MHIMNALIATVPGMQGILIFAITGLPRRSEARMMIG
jgi:hypothetical protein